MQPSKGNSLETGFVKCIDSAQGCGHGAAGAQQCISIIPEYDASNLRNERREQRGRDMAQQRAKELPVESGVKLRSRGHTMTAGLGGPGLSDSSDARPGTVLFVEQAWPHENGAWLKPNGARITRSGNKMAITSRTAFSLCCARRP